MNIFLRLLLVVKRIAKAVLPHSVYEKLRVMYLKRSVVSSEILTSGMHSSVSDVLPAGVNLFAYFFKNSAGTETLLLQQALEAAGIPYQTIDLNDPEKFVANGLATKMYRTNLIVCHAASGTPARMRLFGLDLEKFYNICYWAWELPEVPDEYCVGLDLFQEIWTISTFCTAALEKKATVPVLTVPLYANPDRTMLPDGRKHFGIDSDAFLFMFAYDCNSFVDRKNPQALVQAFLKAFTPEDRHVGLILKLAYPERYQEHIDILLETLSPYQNIYYIKQFLSDDEMRTLIGSADAFVTLHRSEGFGNIPLEAMSLGTPVIATEWSGNMEYMNHSNAALVSYQLVPVDGRYVGSVPGDSQVWAEADVDEAAAYMRRMVSDKGWRDGLIACGKRTADEVFTPQAIGQIMRERLTVLKQI